MSDHIQNASKVVQGFIDATTDLSNTVSSQQITDDLFRELSESRAERTQSESEQSDGHGGCEQGAPNQSWHWDIGENDSQQNVLESEELVQMTTFSTRGQSRSGSQHGRGGRKAGSGFRVRRLYRSFAQAVLFHRMYFLCKEEISHATKLLIEGLESSSGSEAGAVVSNAAVHDIGKKLISTLKSLSENGHPYTIQHLPFSVLGVSAHFTKSDSFLTGPSLTRNSRERHVVNTWLECDGGIRCTCIGSTQSFILDRNNEFQVPCCEHSEAFACIFNDLAKEVFGAPKMDREALHSCFSKLQPDLMETLRHHLPFYSYVHRGLGAVLVCNDFGDRGSPSWIPIRRVQRKGIKYLCAFCDLVNTNSCHHVRKLRDLQMGENGTSPPLLQNAGKESGAEKYATRNNRGWMKHPAISFLPVAPINCSFSLKRDQEICDVMKRNGTFMIPAPSHCIYCNSQRCENTKEKNMSGNIICTIGACRVEIHTYKCSVCNRRFSAEGREEGIFMHSVCAAATHAVLREQLIGFALGNGTLSSRLNQLHSKLSSLEDSKLFKDPVGCKSSKTLYSMCIGFVHLMIMDPPKSLFWCSTCQKLDPKTGEVSVPRTTCVDGIWAGYLKKSSRAFRNVSVSCKPQNPARSKNRKRTGRPPITLLRLEKTASILIQAVKGEKIDITNVHVNALVGAIRIVNGELLPSDFYPCSVCGTLPTDYDQDIGECRLRKIHCLTETLFDESILLHRLLKPLQNYFERQCKRRRKKSRVQGMAKLYEVSFESARGGENKRATEEEAVCDTGKKRRIVPEYCADVVSRALEHIRLDADQEDRVPWHPSIANSAERDDLGNQVMKLYKSFLQGPLTHLIRRADMNSASLLAEFCIRNDPSSFMKEMVNKDCFNPQKDGKDSKPSSNITETSRLLTGGLVSAAAIDSDVGMGVSSKKGLLWSFGVVLKEVLCVVVDFYKFYEEDMRNGSSSAADYGREWSSTESEVLRNKFNELSTSSEYQDETGLDYEDKFVTGTFFPSFPQVRPMPFNDEGRRVGDEDAFGFCSKHYLQKNGSFTPGAITFCCACKHPITIGYKVLEWDEGPRSILDVLASRFPKFPDYVIYDFACGVYKSAVHPLWWSIQNSTLVSDPFHGCNHKCSPAFLPSAHVELDMRNTIAHEQRNRPIACIKGSLQQTSQDVYISLLSFQIIINNIQAKIRTASHRQDPVQNRSAKDIEWGYFQRLKMRCPCCKARGARHLMSVKPAF